MTKEVPFIKEQDKTYRKFDRTAGEQGYTSFPLHPTGVFSSTVIETLSEVRIMLPVAFQSFFFSRNNIGCSFPWKKIFIYKLSTAPYGYTVIYLSNIYPMFALQIMLKS